MSERRHRHDIIKQQRTCDYCDRTHSASSWAGRWIHRCLGCYAAYYRSRFVQLAPGIYRTGDMDNGIYWLGER